MIFLVARIKATLTTLLRGVWSIRKKLNNSFRGTRRQGTIVSTEAGKKTEEEERNDHVDIFIDYGKKVNLEGG